MSENVIFDDSIAVKPNTASTAKPSVAAVTAINGFFVFTKIACQAIRGCTRMFFEEKAIEFICKTAKMCK